jgi:hypothetical protein
MMVSPYKGSLAGKAGCKGGAAFIVGFLKNETWVLLLGQHQGFDLSGSHGDTNLINLEN